MACILEYAIGIKFNVGGLDKNKPNSNCPTPTPVCLTLVITEPAEQSLHGSESLSFHSIFEV